MTDNPDTNPNAALPRDADCIFCKIIAGEIPCHELFSDEHVLSFLDIGPLATGHALIVPKGHYVTLDEMPDWLVGQCAQILRRVARRLIPAVGAAGWNVLQNNGAVAGQDVGHVHFHIIPRVEGDGLGYRWNAGEIDHDEAATLAAMVKSQVDR